MPFFVDLNSPAPTVEHNPFDPVVVEDEVPAEIAESEEEIPAEPIVDTGLPVPAHYDFDMMQALVQDPFRLFVYWQLKDNPFERLPRIFPAHEAGNFHSVLKLVDETNHISVLFNAAFMREYWFDVYPDRQYRVELGLHSPRYGYIKLLGSQPTHTPRSGPSDQIAEEEDYQIATDDYLRVLRESHLVPERAFTIDGLLPLGDVGLAFARTGAWESLPPSFRRLMMAIRDIQEGREYDRWWERLNEEELAALVREFLDIIKQMGDGELGYMLLLRHLPELLRRAVQAESPGEQEMIVDKPMTIYLAEHLGQAASEMNFGSSSEQGPAQSLINNSQSAAEELSQEQASQGRWIPSMSLG